MGNKGRKTFPSEKNTGYLITDFVKRLTLTELYSSKFSPDLTCIVRNVNIKSEFVEGAFIYPQTVLN